MCTSFIYRGNDTIIAMNYDNHGKNFKLAPYHDDLFLFTIHDSGKDYPLFGVRNDGVMVNQQVVNECSEGRFRIGWRTLHTAKMVGTVLKNRKKTANLRKYVEKHTIVCPPGNSLHIFIARTRDESCIIEPGRGEVWFPVDKRYIVMSNCPVTDFHRTGEWNGTGVDRQLKAEEMLENADASFGVQDAVKVLEAIHQEDPMWTTEVSFIYSYNENKVYYCYDHQYDILQEYPMTR